MNLARNNSIAHLIADREFVGSDWLAFLNSSGIHYHIRIRENFLVNGQPCYLSGSKIKDKEGKPELKILVSYCNAEESRRLARQNSETYGQSICHCYDCICLVLPRWYSYSRKYQGDKGFEPRQKGQKLVQIWAGLHLTVPSEQQKPISNQYLQIFVIYLGDFCNKEVMFTPSTHQFPAAKGQEILLREHHPSGCGGIGTR